jgi:hypothetical protein
MTPIPSAPVPDIFSQALHLPENERADLAYQLLVSLGDAPAFVEDESEMESLVAERIEMIARGECELEDWRDTLKHLDRALAEERGEA